jgi:hypothetical protein
MKARLASILVAALVVAGGTAARARADNPPPVPVPVLAQPVDFTDVESVPPMMVVVFVPAGDGFSDGGDGPGGITWVLPGCFPDGFSDGGDAPDGFSDGGDLPVGFVPTLAQPAGDDFWRDGLVPDGLVPVLAWLPPDGFSDGGDVPSGFLCVLFPSTTVTP